MVKVLTFDKAIEDSKAFRERHLLLGNGFSIACDSRFDYRSLLQKAKSSNAFSKRNNIPKVFTKMQTKDFEQVIKILEDASKVSKIYNKSSPYAVKMIKDAKALKNILIGTIVSTHPDTPQAIDSNKFADCREFLKYFLRDEEMGGGEIYTLNYDFLLYWARVHERPRLGNDGFGRKNGALIWSNADQQTVHYLHGALHLYDDGFDLCKHSWTPGSPLRHQVLNAISSDKFPLFVAEGKSEQKLLKIKNDEYLRHCYDNFVYSMGQPNDALFIFGHSLKNKDKHILNCIAEGKIPRIYVDLHGKATLKRNVDKITFAMRLKARRLNGYPLEVKFFDAKTAKIWG